MNNHKHLAFFGTLTMAIFLLASCGGGKPNYKVSLKNDTDSVSYYIGYSMGAQVANSDIDNFNIDAMAKGVQEAIKHGKKVDEEKMQEMQMFMQVYFTKLQTRVNEKNLKEGEKFLEENKKKSGVVTLPSGVQYKIIKDGTGIKPTREDQVEVIYHGSLPDGTVFQSTKDSGEAVPFQVGGVVPGFSEALTLMSEGAIWEVYIPAELGYGEHVRQGGPIPPNSALIFEINLVKVIKGEE